DVFDRIDGPGGDAGLAQSRGERGDALALEVWMELARPYLERAEPARGRQGNVLLEGRAHDRRAVQRQTHAAIVARAWGRGQRPRPRVPCWAPQRGRRANTQHPARRRWLRAPVSSTMDDGSVR